MTSQEIANDILSLPTVAQRVQKVVEVFNLVKDGQDQSQNSAASIILEQEGIMVDYDLGSIVTTHTAICRKGNTPED